MNNCRLWAKKMRREFGGYTAQRRTRIVIFGRWRGWWDHWFWSPDLETWYSYTTDPKSSVSERFLGIPKVLFKGTIKAGDE